MESLEEALFYAALAAYEADTNKTEHMAGIYRTAEGKYGISRLLTSGKSGKVSGGIAIPKGSALAALVHNHPASDQRADLFSPDDVQQAAALGVLSAIVYGNDMRISLFDPAKDKPDRKRMAIGSPFDYIPEVRPVGRRIGQ